MRIILAAVGKAKSGPEQELYRQYVRRLSGGLVLKEVEEKRPLPTPERVQREGEMLLSVLPPGAVLVALDERGKHLSSRDFAGKIRQWQDQGRADLAFVIGGADGHSDAVRQRADLLLCLGTMTWPHMLVRAMIAEQIWRAQAILGNHPYHRD